MSALTETLSTAQPLQLEYLLVIDFKVRDMNNVEKTSVFSQFDLFEEICKC